MRMQIHFGLLCSVQLSSHTMQRTGLIIVLTVLYVFDRVITCNFGDSKLRHWANQRWSDFTDSPCSILSGGNQNGNLDASPKVKVFLFQKDEEEVLSDWLQYYSYMFGAKNLVVIDHDSQSQNVCRVLELFKQCGTEVLTYTGSFDKKHAILTREMRSHNDTFLLPLDADEFIVPHGPEGELAVNRAALLNAFRDLPIDGRKYKFSYSYFARPKPTDCWVEANSSNKHSSRHDWHRRVLRSQLATDKEEFFARSKTFYHSNGFLSTDQGNHFGTVVHDKGVYNDHPIIANNLTHFFAPLKATMLHYSLSSYRSVKMKYLRGFAAYNFTLDSNCSTAPGGRSYCHRGKTYLTDAIGSRDFYLFACLSKEQGVPLKWVSDWFQNYTLTLPQIVS